MLDRFSKKSLVFEQEKVDGKTRRAYLSLPGLEYLRQLYGGEIAMVVGSLKVMTWSNGKWTAFCDRADDPTETDDLASKPNERGSRLRRSIKVFEAEGRNPTVGF